MTSVHATYLLRLAHELCKRVIGEDAVEVFGQLLAIVQSVQFRAGFQAFDKETDVP